MRLKLNKEIYQLGFIKQATNAFKALAQITIEDNGAYWICSFFDCERDEQQTISEFENYLIDLLNCQ